MDFYQGVVYEYLGTDPAVFINSECCIELPKVPGSDASAPSWYCDAIAVDFRQKTVFLCEVSYERTLQSLIKRLKGWASNWNEVSDAIRRDCCIPADWRIQAWVFIPYELKSQFERRLATVTLVEDMPPPLVNWLEDVAPWKHKSWNRPPVKMEPNVGSHNDSAEVSSDANRPNRNADS